MSIRFRRFRFAVVALLFAGPSAARAAAGSLEYLGSIVLPADLVHAGVPVGGLSGLAYEASSGLFWAISDDRAERGPARVLRLRLDLGDGRLDPADVTVVDAVELRRADGSAFPGGSLDPEGIALGATTFFVSSEGEAKEGVDPWVAEFGRDGRLVRELPLPERYRVDPAGVPGRGVRDNQGFEALAISEDGTTLWAATEGSLQQEGPVSDVGVASRARLLKWRLTATGAAPQEFLLPLDAVHRPPLLPTAFRVNGFSELLPVGDGLWVLEREFSAGPGHRVRLQSVSLADSAAPAKTLLVDFDELKLPTMDNYEGMTFGPRLADGRTTLVVVSDDNFQGYGERTHFLLFAADLRGGPETAIARLQGAAHRSPWEGRWVWGVEGLVTAIDRNPKSAGLWIESWAPDADERTSEGVFVAATPAAELAVGDRARVQGRIEEVAAGGGLPVTRLAARAVERLPAGGAKLAAPSALFVSRRIPGHVEDDALARFEPGDDALDFWESLEGMRATVPAGTVVGPRLSFGEIVVLPDGVSGLVRTARGGVRLGSAGANLQRVFIAPRLLTGRMPDLSVGDRVTGETVGIVDYSFSNYKLLAIGGLATQAGGGSCDAATKLRSDATHLTIGNFNVENLAATAEPARFTDLAAEVVGTLASPAILALQEIQDDSGSTDDGTVSAAATLDKVSAAIAAAGGPRYQAVWIDPENNRDGGQPGGNIRVAFLYDPARVGFERRGAAGPNDVAAVDARGRLTLNPARIAPAASAFTLQNTEGVRRSLAAEFTFAGVPIVVVNNHWSSRFAEDRTFGARQPPNQPTTAFRLAQAKEIRGFVEAVLAADPRGRVAILGDLNDFEWTTPIQEIARPPFENLMLRIPVAARYSYNFEGASQVLDHVIVSPVLAREAEVEELHVNSDCADPLRTSDHDPLVVRLRVR